MNVRKKSKEIKDKVNKLPARFKKSNGNPIGRPSKAETVNLEQVYCLCLLGLSNEELAIFLKINTDTFYEWVDKWKDFSEVLYRGRKGADAEVAVSIFQRAKGCTLEEDVVKVLPGKLLPKDVKHNSLTVVGYTKNSTIVKVRTLKHYPPDVQAAMYFLNNRAKQYWKNKVDDEDAPPPATGPVVVNIITDDETKAKLLRAEQDAQQRKFQNHGNEQQPEL